MNRRGLLKSVLFSAAGLVWALAGGLMGCRTNNQTVVKVAGSSGAKFTTHYRFGRLKGSIAAIARGESKAVVDFRPPGEGEMEIEKEDASQELIVLVYEGKRQRFRIVAPPGTRGVRLSRQNGEWQGEPF